MKQKIVMLIEDFMGYKNFLELKNWLHINKYLNKVELSYHYIDMYNGRCDYNHKDLNYVDNSFYDMSKSGAIEKYFDLDITKYGQFFGGLFHTNNILLVLENYLKDTNSMFDNITVDNEDLMRSIKLKNSTIEEFESTVDDIPKADLYLISLRNAYYSASEMLQVGIALILIKKYKDCKIFMGGGGHSTELNSTYKLFKKISETYLDNQIEYLIGDIGHIVYNYLNGLDYYKAYGLPDTNETLPPLEITADENTKFMHNKFSVTYSTGCINRCPFCVASFISNFNLIKNYTMYNDYFKYLSDNYPDSDIFLNDNELNHNREYFINLLNNFIDLQLKNRVIFFLDMTTVDDDIIEMLSKFNCGIEISFDFLSGYYNEKNSYYVIHKCKDIINKLKTNKVFIKRLFSISNVPNNTTILNEDFQTVYKAVKQIPNIEFCYREFRLNTASLIYIEKEKYGISCEYYKNDNPIFNDIKEVFKEIPIIYYRNDYNRKDLINIYYEFLLKNLFILRMTNRNLIKTEMDYALSSCCFACKYSYDLIETHNTKLDIEIDKYCNNIISKSEE